MRTPVPKTSQVDDLVVCSMQKGNPPPRASSPEISTSSSSRRSPSVPRTATSRTRSSAAPTPSSGRTRVPTPPCTGGTANGRVLLGHVQTTGARVITGSRPRRSSWWSRGGRWDSCARYRVLRPAPEENELDAVLPPPLGEAREFQSFRDGDGRERARHRRGRDAARRKLGEPPRSREIYLSDTSPRLRLAGPARRAHPPPQSRVCRGGVSLALGGREHRDLPAPRAVRLRLLRWRPARAR